MRIKAMQFDVDRVISAADRIGGNEFLEVENALVSCAMTLASSGNERSLIDLADQVEEIAKRLRS